MKYFLLFFIFLSLTIEAKLKIEISQGSKDLPKIAVVPFKSNLNEGESISFLIQDNLTLFGEFKALPKEEMLSFPSSEKNFFNRDWKILNESIFHSFTHFDLELKIMISIINEYPNDVYLEPLNSSILKSLPTVMKKGVALVIDNHII